MMWRCSSVGPPSTVAAPSKPRATGSASSLCTGRMRSSCPRPALDAAAPTIVEHRGAAGQARGPRRNPYARTRRWRLLPTAVAKPELATATGGRLQILVTETAGRLLDERGDRVGPDVEQVRMHRDGRLEVGGGELDAKQVHAEVACATGDLFF